MKDSHLVLQTLLRTEKGAVLMGDNKYIFRVQKDVNKIEIKHAVEKIYKVKVQDVNTQVVPGKSKRVRTQMGMTPEWKKAVVTLKDGHKIDLA